MRRHAKAPSAVGSASKRAASRQLLALAALTLLASLALGVSLAGAIAPTVTIENAANVEYTSADVKGTVDPGDHGTFYRFEYATEADFSNASSRGEGFIAENEGGQTVEATLTELSPATTYHLRLVAENESGLSEAIAASTFTTKAVAAPTVSIDPVTIFTGTTAHFSGTINPNAPKPAAEASDAEKAAFKVDWHFQCTPQCSGFSSSTVPADNANHTVSVDAAGLGSNADYEVTLVASNAGGQVEVGPEDFKTDAVGPETISLPASPVTQTTAIVGGSVDPNGSATTYFIEYASQVDFSDVISVPASENADAGSGQGLVPVSSSITGLSPDANYFFRVVATNAVDTDTSTTQSFHTYALAGSPPSCPNAQFRTGLSALLPECRAYEKVTPNDKRAQDARPGAVLDADHIYFSAKGPLLDGEPEYRTQPRYLATRTPSGWDLRSGQFAPSTQAVAFSDDFFQEILNQTQGLSLAPSDTDQGRDVYARTASGVTQVSLGSLGGNSGDLALYAGQSADGTHILFQTAEHLELADAGRSSGQQLYERFGGQTRVVGVLPDAQCAALSLPAGCVDPGGAVLGNGVDPTCSSTLSASGTTNAISVDGSVAFFESPDPCAGGDHQLYARVDGEDTVEVSASQCTRISPVCDDAGHPATFQGAADDGSRVLFSTDAQLTNDDLDATTDLYLYDRNSGALTRITDIQGAENCGGSGFIGLCGVSAVSADARRVYFVAAGLGVQGGTSKKEGLKEGLYLYDDHVQQTRLVARLGSRDPATIGFVQFGLAVSAEFVNANPNGDVLVFQSNARLTSFDNSNPGCAGSVNTSIDGFCFEIYRYDALANRLQCVSCNSTGVPPLHASGSVYFDLSADISNARHLGRLSGPAAGSTTSPMVSNDGSTVVFASWDRLVANDSNGDLDIYAWREGKASLLTTGTGAAATPDSLAGISGDGRSILFATKDQLLPEDTDFLSDLYDARIDGFPQQMPVTPPCSGDACRNALPAPPVDATAATPTFSGSGNATPRRSRCAKGRGRKSGRCVKKRTKRHGKDKKNHGAKHNRGGQK